MFVEVAVFIWSAAKAITPRRFGKDADMSKVILRQKLDVDHLEYLGRIVRAGTVVRTNEGYDAVLIAEGLEPVIFAGHKSRSDAAQALYRAADNALLDFLGGPLKNTCPRQPAPRKSRAMAKVVAVYESGGKNPRAHGRCFYTITGETEGQIKYAARDLYRHYAGYGISFGDLETIHGVLTMRGSRSDNCE